jgi:hypothetical protein
MGTPSTRSITSGEVAILRCACRRHQIASANTIWSNSGTVKRPTRWTMVLIEAGIILGPPKNRVIHVNALSNIFPIHSCYGQYPLMQSCSDRILTQYCDDSSFNPIESRLVVSTNSCFFFKFTDLPIIMYVVQKGGPSINGMKRMHTIGRRTYCGRCRNHGHGPREHIIGTTGLSHVWKIIVIDDVITFCCRRRCRCYSCFLGHCVALFSLSLLELRDVLPFYTILARRWCAGTL